MTTPAVIDAAPEHLPAVAAIYAAAVADGPATFDLQAPPLAWWRGVLESVDPRAGHLMLVSVDDTGAVLGYAKSGRFRPKAAYDSTCEISVYIAESARGRRVGHALYAELLGRLDRSGLRLAVAGVTIPNEASVRLHHAHGFTEVGTFAGVGFKGGQPWDVTWFQRPLHGALLLDQLRAILSTAPTRAEAATQAAAAIKTEAGHRQVALYDMAGEQLVTIAAENGAQPTLPVAAGELANGRVLTTSVDGLELALAPALEPQRGNVLGALAVDIDTPLDGLAEGHLARCAETLLPLWTPADVS